MQRLPKQNKAMNNDTPLHHALRMQQLDGVYLNMSQKASAKHGDALVRGGQVELAPRLQRDPLEGVARQNLTAGNNKFLHHTLKCSYGY